MRARAPATVLLAAGAGLTLYTFLQCVPMPVALLRFLAPHNADVWARSLAPLHQAGPSWAPLSLDPVATRVEVLKGVAYLLAFLSALRIARRRDGVRFLSLVVVLTALVLAMSALLHPAFGATRLFGIYEPTNISARHIAPLMNPNNLAGYLNVALCLSLAALLAPDPQVPRAIAAAVVVLLAAAQVWVASRGGVITMVLGALIVIVIARISRTRHAGAVPTLALVTGAILVAGTALFVLSGSDEASNELLDKDVSKLRMFTATMRGLPSMALFGCGRGAFESVFPSFRAEAGYVTYTHPENFIAQWLLEWGIPVGFTGLVLVGFALRPNVMLARSTNAGGAWAGIAALAVQNLGDLGTEIPALVLAAVVCAAIVAAGTPGAAPRWFVERWAARPRWLAIGAGSAATLVLALSLGSLGNDLHDDQGMLHRLALAPNGSTTAMHAAARAAMLRHPAEPYLPFVTALRAVAGRDDDPIPWLGATLERARVYGPAHQLLARVVGGRSPSQARLEYRLAMEQAPNLVDSIMMEAPRMVGGYFDARELLPNGTVGPAVSELLAQAIADRLPASRVRLDADAAREDSAARGPAWRTANDAIQDLESGPMAPWCDGRGWEACVKLALDKSNRLEQMSPDKCEGFALHARARTANHDGSGGLNELDKATEEVTDRLWCLKQLVLVAREVGSEARADRALETIIPLGCGEQAACAETLRWVGQQYEAMGKPYKALGLYRRSFEQAPDDGLLARMAELAMNGGLHAEAAADYEQLARRHPENTDWRRLATAQHDAAMRAAIGL
jgi:tetratricopeptide (TPR) repeat protein